MWRGPYRDAVVPSAGSRAKHASRNRASVDCYCPPHAAAPQRWDPHRQRVDTGHAAFFAAHRDYPVAPSLVSFQMLACIALRRLRSMCMAAGRTTWRKGSSACAVIAGWAMMLSKRALHGSKRIEQCKMRDSEGGTHHCSQRACGRSLIAGNHSGLQRDQSMGSSLSSLAAVCAAAVPAQSAMHGARAVHAASLQE